MRFALPLALLALASLAPACGPVDSERGHLVADPPAVFFPGVVQGGTFDAPLNLLNLGDGPLELLGFEIDGPGFTVQGCGLPTRLEPHQACILSVRHAPQGQGPRSARLVVHSSDLSLPDLVVPLVGPGTEAAVSLSPTAVDFGPVPSGATASRPLHLVNLGLAPALSLQLSWVDGPGDFAASLAQDVLDPGATVDVVVQYSPTGGNSDRATLELRWSGGSYRIEVQGRQDLEAPH